MPLASGPKQAKTCTRTGAGPPGGGYPSRRRGWYGLLRCVMTEEYLLVLSTCPDQAVAAEIATAVIEQRLAACVNQLGGVTSWFRWQGQLQREDEILLLIKTTRTRLAELETAIHSMHPYETPEIIAVALTAGSEAYLKWISDSTTA